MKINWLNLRGLLLFYVWLNAVLVVITFLSGVGWAVIAESQDSSLAPAPTVLVDHLQNMDVGKLHDLVFMQDHQIRSLMGRIIRIRRELALLYCCMSVFFLVNAICQYLAYNELKGSVQGEKKA